MWQPRTMLMALVVVQGDRRLALVERHQHSHKCGGRSAQMGRHRILLMWCTPEHVTAAHIQHAANETKHTSSNFVFCGTRVRELLPFVLSTVDQAGVCVSPTPLGCGDCPVGVLGRAFLAPLSSYVQREHRNVTLAPLPLHPSPRHSQTNSDFPSKQLVLRSANA